MEFVQIIEFETDRIEEMDRWVDEWAGRHEGELLATSSLNCADRDRPNRYYQIVRFRSAGDAEKNNDLPATQEIAQFMRKIATGEPRFVNLDLRRDMTP